MIYAGLKWEPFDGGKSGHCVYLLVHDGEVVYAGQTRNLSERLKQHALSGLCVAYVRATTKENKNRLERRAIRNLFPPKFNKSAPIG